MDRIKYFLKAELKITYVIIFINIILWLVTELAGGSASQAVLVKFGALYEPAVLDGEIWRMVSAAFLHIGIIHLAINMYTLYQLGNFVESFFGRGKFIATYVLTAIVASTVSLIFSGGISAGASGALFGLTGLLLGNAWAKKTYSFDLPIDEKQLIPFVAYNLIYGFIIPGIDNFAHIGGLLGGLALGFVFDPKNSFDPSRWKQIVPKVLAWISVIILAVSAVFWSLSILNITD
jgi:rhomboid protease GluP